MKKEYTHYALYPIFWNIMYIPCFYNDENENIAGRNKFYDFLLNIAIWYDFEFSEGFLFWVGEKIEQEND